MLSVTRSSRAWEDGEMVGVDLGTPSRGPSNREMQVDKMGVRVRIGRTTVREV